MEPIAELLDEKQQPTSYRKVKFRDFVATHYEYLSKRERVIDSIKI